MTTTTTNTPEPHADKTAVLYLRVSTAEQATRGGRDEGFSLPAQRQANTRKADALGAVVVAEFVDAGESGTKVDKRTGLQDMLAYIREHQVDYCIVHKLDRLARSRADDVSIHFALKQAGVTLVSVSENIDETPSGMLMHGIMSSIAEFYSNNLRTEVTKGLVQKASLGGTVSRAPLGYKNVHLTDELGRVNRTVQIDAERAQLITWAFYRYAEGDCSLSILLDQLTARGLTTRPTPKFPAKEVAITSLHKILKNPYYKGELHYRGIAYPGLHEPLVDPGTWQQVQDLLAAHNTAGTHQRRNDQYLRGSLFCGDCGSRLMFTTAKNRHGTRYPYYICSGRSRKTTTCQRQAMALDVIEELVENEYKTIALSPTLRDNIEDLVLEDFDALQASARSDQQQLEQQRSTLTAQREKLLQAHYAGAIPLDLLKVEQDRIASQLGHIQSQLATTDANFEQARTMLADCLDFTRDCHAAYMAASDKERRLFNQAFFTKIYIDEDDLTRERSVRVDYQEPFDILLSRLIPAHKHRELAEKARHNETARQANLAGGNGVDEVQGSHTSDLVALSSLDTNNSGSAFPMSSSLSKNTVVALSSVDTNKWLPLLARDWAAVPASQNQSTPDVESRRPLRQRQKRLTEAEGALLVVRYAEGATVYELADEFGIERRTAAVRLRGAGVVLRRQPANAEQVADMVRQYESGLSLAKVAHRTGFSSKTVLNYLRAEGIRTRDSHGRERG